MSTREPVLSPDWYRVAAMRPRLRSGVRIVRQRTRGELWYALSDPVSGRHHRVNAQAFSLIARCDGRLSLDEVWSTLMDRQREHAPTQGEAIRVLSQAFAAGLLVGDIAPDARAIVRAHEKVKRKRRRAAVNPLSFRVPLWDPDAFLDAHVGILRRLFHPALLWVGLAVVLLGLLALLVNLGQVVDHAQRNLAGGRMLLLVWLAYPVMKVLHELAHAACIKVRGGEVHELGVAVMLLTPVPYVDASASVAFARKANRVEVAAAGIFVELLLASVALLLWLALEPGLARDAAFAVVAVGLLSTVLVNGNPLLRFDGYFVLTEAAELPNLAPRSAQFWLYGIKRHLLALRGERFSAPARGETPWLLAYAPLSWLYRTVLVGSVVVLVAQWSAAVGLLMLAAGLWWVAGKPLLTALRWLLASPRLRGRRVRAVALAGGMLAGLLAAAVWLPLPHRSHAPAVVWLPDDTQVRLAAAGEVQRFTVADGQTVAVGDTIAELHNDTLRAELAQAAAELQVKRVEHGRLRDEDPSRATWMREEVAALETRRASLQQQVDALVVRAGAAGRVVVDPRRVVPGQYLAQGELVAQILPAGPLTVRALVRNDDIALVREQATGAVVRLAHDGGRPYPADVQAAVPQAVTTLPSAALGDAAGGPVAVDPADPSGRRAREPRFVVDLRVPGLESGHVGARAMVSFDHGDASVAALVGRAIRQSFLRWFAR